MLVLTELLSLFQTDPPARGNHEREGEQDHHLCGDQEAL